MVAADLMSDCKVDAGGRRRAAAAASTSTTPVSTRNVKNVTGIVPCAKMGRRIILLAIILLLAAGLAAGLTAACLSSAECSGGLNDELLQEWPGEKRSPDVSCTADGQSDEGDDLIVLRKVLTRLGSEASLGLSDDELCDMEGVTCEDGEGVVSIRRVVGLNLVGQGLSGTLPEELGRLTALRDLNLAKNALAGRLPGYGVLGRLTDLRTLWLSENMFEGQLEQGLSGWLACLASLEQLVLYGNRLSGVLPDSLGNLKQLRLLMLDRNLFTGVLPAGIFALPEVQDLLLFGNDFTGLGNSDWRKMRSLRNAMLHDNPRLQGQLPELPASIEKLDLRNCAFSGAFPPGWSFPGPGLPKLRALYLASSSSTLLAACESWARVLDCGGDEEMLHMPALTLLDLSGLPLACPAQLLLRAFGYSPLSTVRLGGTQLTGSLDQNAFHLAYASGESCYEGPGPGYETLAVLDLSNNSVTALQWNLFPFERPPPALQMLSLANNALEELDPEWLMPSQVVLTGNPWLRSYMPLSNDVTDCSNFWRERHNNEGWNSEASWDPCLRSRLKGTDCKAGLEGFAVQLSPGAAKAVAMPLPRIVLADRSFSSKWDCSAVRATSEVVARPAAEDVPDEEPRPAVTEMQTSRTNLLRLGLSPIGFHAVKAAVALELPRLLDDRPRTCQELTVSLKQQEIVKHDDPEAALEGRICRFLKALAGLGLVTLDDRSAANDAYHRKDAFAYKANSATLLLRDKPASAVGAPPMHAFFDYGHVFDHYMAALAETVETGHTGAEILHGQDGIKSIFDVNEDENVLFDKAFSAIETRIDALEAVPWPKTSFQLCDIGGGAGVDAELLVKMGVPAKITIFDLQPAHVSFPEKVSSIVYDMFQPFPLDLRGKCDFFWLDFVIQDFTDARIVSMLRHLRVAAPPTARLALLQHVLGAHGGELERFKLEMDLWQMVAFGGRERSREDFQQMLAAGGWKLDSIKLIHGEACVVTASALADPRLLELASTAVQMPGPWLGSLGSGEALAVWKEDLSSTSTIAVVRDQRVFGEPLVQQPLPDMDFIGIWETVIPLAQRRFALLYCSKSFKAPAALIGKLQSNSEASIAELLWPGEPTSFAMPGGHTSEHFFAHQSAVEMPCAMRISAAALNGGKLLVCRIHEGSEISAGIYCSSGKVHEHDVNIVWDAPMQIYKGVMAAPCSNLPMHRFATLKVVAVNGSSWAIFYTDGALVRNGGRCDDTALEEVAHCEGGSCNAFVRLLHAGPQGVEIGGATLTPFGQLHMLDAVTFGDGKCLTCFLAQTNFPSLEDEGRCASVLWGNKRSGPQEANDVLKWGPVASLGPSAWDITVSALSWSRSQFVVAFERGYRGHLLITMVGSVNVHGQVHFGPPLEGSAPLNYIRAQRPSLAALSAEEIALTVADQSSDLQPVVVKMRLGNASSCC